MPGVTIEPAPRPPPEPFMNARTILAFLAVLGPLVAGDAAAQKLSLRIDKGLVTLDAQNVTVDEVLARWIDTTGLSVISKSGEGSDIPVSLQLEAVPEQIGRASCRSREGVPEQLTHAQTTR